MIKRVTYIFLLIFVTSISLSEMGCRKNELEPRPNDVGFNYFPLDVGSTWIYQVDSIDFDAFGKSIDTFSFLVRHEIVDTIVDNQGVRGSIVEVSRTDSLMGGFAFDRNMVKRIADYRAEVIDSNVRVINLVFPPTLYKFWDANVFNTKMKEEYEVLEVLATENIDTNTYSDVIHVVQRDESFKTLRSYGIEKYANGIGMVYAHQIHWTKKSIGDTTEIPDGFNYTYTLKSFEK